MLSVVNPSNQPLVGHDIDWGQIAPFVRGRPEFEDMFVGRQLLSTTGSALLPLVISRAVLNVGSGPFVLTFAASTAQGITSAQLAIRMRLGEDTGGGFSVEPPFLKFGTVFPAQARELIGNRRGQHENRNLKLWDPRRGAREHRFDAALSSVVQFKGDSLFYRYEESGRPSWQDIPVGHMSLTPAGLYCTLASAQSDRQIVVLSHEKERVWRLCVLCTPAWIQIAPKAFDVPPGKEATLNARLVTDELGRGVYEGNIDLAQQEGEKDVLIRIPVSCRISLPGPVAEITPMPLDFGFVRPNEVTKRNLLIANRGSGTLKVEIGSTSGPIGLVSTEVVNRDERIDSANRVKVQLKTSRLHCVGPVEVDVPVRTNSCIIEQRMMAMRVKVFVGELLCEPTDLSSMVVAYGDELTVPCRIRRSNDSRVRLASLCVVLDQPGPWRVATEMRLQHSFQLIVKAPSDPRVESFSGAVRLQDLESGLSGEYPVRASVVAASAKLDIALTKPVEASLKRSERLKFSNLRNLSLVVHNTGRTRLLVERIRYHRNEGPPLRVAALPDAPVESGRKYVTRIRCPLAWFWLPRQEWSLRGTFFLQCRNHDTEAAALPVMFSVVRKRRSP